MQDNNTEITRPKMTRESLREALKIFEFIRPYRWKFIFGLVLLFLSSTVFMIFPYTVGQLREIARSMQGTHKFSDELDSIGERLEASIVDLQEIAKDCERIDERTEHDPQRIAEVQERLNVMYKLQKKHAVSSVEELLKIQNRLERPCVPKA